MKKVSNCGCREKARLFFLSSVNVLHFEKASMNSETFDLVRASRALGISATYVSQAEEAAKSFENTVKHLIQQVINWQVKKDFSFAL